MSDDVAGDTGNGIVEAIIAGLIDAFSALEERVSSPEGGEESADMPFDEWLSRIATDCGLEITFRGFDTGARAPE